jgi:hypothetical protein
MSSKIGIIAEGVIDYILLPPLLEQIARKHAFFNWPIIPDDLGDIIPIRKRGHGGVLEAVRRLVKYLKTQTPSDYALFVILLDRRTHSVHREVKKLIRYSQLFVLGIAIEEIEAWWLADRQSTLAWLGLEDRPHGNLRYWLSGYNPESDANPKKTLDELSEISSNLTKRYGDGSTELAQDFVTCYWTNCVQLNDIERDCPHGFRPFSNNMTNAFRRAKSRLSRIL